MSLELQASLRSRSPILIVGPTASGKTGVALEVAERIGGEVISVDSMQVYRGLDIGTAKPGPSERARVPHHLIDVVDLNESFDAAQFSRLAAAAEEQIRARGSVPIFCGGTGLYIKAHFEGLSEMPPADERLRAMLESTPLPELLRELELRDPQTFAKIDRQNPRRVIRALEVIRLTGKPFSLQRATWISEERPAQRGLIFGLLRKREDLNRRIDRRVEEMFAQGLVAETRRLLEKGLEQNRTAMQALGYRQVVDHLRGERSLEETISLVKTKTRQYARRQMTWFRRQLPVKWIPVAADEPPVAIAEKLL